MSCLILVTLSLSIYVVCRCDGGPSVSLPITPGQYQPCICMISAQSPCLSIAPVFPLPHPARLSASLTLCVPPSLCVAPSPWAAFASALTASHLCHVSSLPHCTFAMCCPCHIPPLSCTAHTLSHRLCCALCVAPLPCVGPVMLHCPRHLRHVEMELMWSSGDRKSVV